MKATIINKVEESRVSLKEANRQLKETIIKFIAHEKKCSIEEARELYEKTQSKILSGEKTLAA